MSIVPFPYRSSAHGIRRTGPLDPGRGIGQAQAREHGGGGRVRLTEWGLYYTRCVCVDGDAVFSVLLGLTAAGEKLKARHPSLPLA